MHAASIYGEKPETLGLHRIYAEWTLNKRANARTSTLFYVDKSYQDGVHCQVRLMQQAQTPHLGSHGT